MNDEQLIEAATDARNKAYVPYSNYSVGAALLTSGGEVYTAGNIENAAYPMTICAERTSLFKAFSDNDKDYQTLAVVADSNRPVPPCGACRQVMAELCPGDMRVLLANLDGDVQTTTVSELLPGAFNAGDMNHDK